MEVPEIEAVAQRAAKVNDCLKELLNSEYVRGRRDEDYMRIAVHHGGAISLDYVLTRIGSKVI